MSGNVIQFQPRRVLVVTIKTLKVTNPHKAPVKYGQSQKKV
jgi:hypothetical protein